MRYLHNISESLVLISKPTEAVKENMLLIFNSCGVINFTNPALSVNPLCTLTKAATVHMQPMAAAPKSADELLVVKANDRGYIARIAVIRL